MNDIIPKNNDDDEFISTAIFEIGEASEASKKRQ
ncbi:MAG: hypothetical protein ACI9BD_000028 [Candidatus Marinamargulisbacteria bacterium]|jgi:hypothetical protein